MCSPLLLLISLHLLVHHGSLLLLPSFVFSSQVCTCVDGLDKCEAMGTCTSDKCPRFARLTAANRDKIPCLTNAGCADGFVCQRESFSTYSCSNSIVTGRRGQALVSTTIITTALGHTHVHTRAACPPCLHSNQPHWLLHRVVTQAGRRAAQRYCNQYFCQRICASCQLCG